MENALDLLKYDNRAEAFVRRIKDEELEFHKECSKSFVDRTTLFPDLSVTSKTSGDDTKIVLVTNIRKKDKDGVWWRIHQTKGLTSYMDDIDRMKLIAIDKFIIESYNIALNFILPCEYEMSFTKEKIAIKCAYQWLSEEDRMAAIFNMESPAAYVINKYMKKK